MNVLNFAKFVHHLPNAVCQKSLSFRLREQMLMKLTSDVLLNLDATKICEKCQDLLCRKEERHGCQCQKIRLTMAEEDSATLLLLMLFLLLLLLLLLIMMLL